MEVTSRSSLPDATRLDHVLPASSLPDATRLLDKILPVSKST